MDKRIIDALQIDDLPAVSTLSNCVIGRDETGNEPECNFNYASVVGMLLNLTGHAHLELTFAVSQCECFACAPNSSGGSSQLMDSHNKLLSKRQWFNLRIEYLVRFCLLNLGQNS